MPKAYQQQAQMKFKLRLPDHKACEFKYCMCCLPTLRISPPCTFLKPKRTKSYISSPSSWTTSGPMCMAQTELPLPDYRISIVPPILTDYLPLAKELARGLESNRNEIYSVSTLVDFITL